MAASRKNTVTEVQSDHSRVSRGKVAGGLGDLEESSIATPGGLGGLGGSVGASPTRAHPHATRLNARARAGLAEENPP